MTSVCRPSEDRMILKVCWVETVTEKQKASNTIDTKRTRAEAILDMPVLTLQSCKLSAEKVVTVSYGRWSFTRDSSVRVLPRIFLVFWKGGCLWEVVACGFSTVMRFWKCLTFKVERKRKRKVEFRESMVLLITLSAFVIVFSLLSKPF